MARYGANTDSPSTNLSTSSTTLTFSSYSTYYCLTAIEPKGYKFLGWHVSSSYTTSYTVPSSYRTSSLSSIRSAIGGFISGETTIYLSLYARTINNKQAFEISVGYYYTAVFAPLTYAVNFNSNGGSGSMSQQIYTYDVAQSIKQNTFTNGDKAFIGWSSSAGNTYNDGDTLNGATLLDTYGTWNNSSNYVYPINTSGSQISFTFTAVWSDYSMSDGDSYATFVFYSSTSHGPYTDVTYTVTENRNGWDIKNVYAAYSSGPLSGVTVKLEYVSSSRWKLPYVSGNYTLMCEYEEYTYSISYNNTSSWSMPSSYVNRFTYTAGLNSRDLPFPTRSNYVFQGWRIGSSSGDYLTILTSSDIDALLSKNGTLYLYLASTYVYSAHSDSNSSSHTTTVSTSSSYWNKDSGVSYGTEEGSTGLVVAGSWTLKNQGWKYYYAAYTVHMGGDLIKALRSGHSVSVYCTVTAYVGGKDGGLFSTGDGEEEARCSIWSGTSTSYSTSYQSTNRVYAKYTGGSWVKSNGTISSQTLYLSASSSPAFTIGLRFGFANEHTSSPGRQYVCFTSVKYTITVDSVTWRTVTLNLNGGSTGYYFPVYSVRNYSYFYVPSVYIDRTGYRFLGWNTSSTASTPSVYPGSSYYISANTTLYAIWERINYTVASYDVYTGSASDSEKYVLVREPHYRTHGTTYNINESIRKQTYSGIIEPNNHDGYTESGSYSSDTLSSSKTSISSSSTNTAEYEAFYVKWALKQGSIEK